MQVVWYGSAFGEVQTMPFVDIDPCDEPPQSENANCSGFSRMAAVLYAAAPSIALRWIMSFRFPNVEKRRYGICKHCAKPVTN